MIIKQISVFVENKAGRLSQITDTLGKNNVNIHALSIADTTNYGILRIIVDNPEEVIKLLKNNGFTSSITDVVALRIKNRPGGLADALRVLADEDIQVEYIYAFLANDADNAHVVMRIEAIEKAEAILKNAGFQGLDEWVKN